MLWDPKKVDSKIGDAFSGTALSVRCYESHPVLKIGKGKLYGGAAFNPVIHDADVYIVLQKGDMKGVQSDPWDKQTRIEVQYAISDMSAPSNVSRFKKMITWVCNQLHEGKSVHVGCIGGHGRTGTVLSAIVAEALGKEDAIQYVRKHYCKKAVESKEQVQFLMKHYGVQTAEPTKGKTVLVSGNGGKGGGTKYLTDGFSRQEPSQGRLGNLRDVNLLTAKPRRIMPDNAVKAAKMFGPMVSNRSLWKAPKKK